MPVAVVKSPILPVCPPIEPIDSSAMSPGVEVNMGAPAFPNSRGMVRQSLSCFGSRTAVVQNHLKLPGFEHLAQLGLNKAACYFGVKQTDRVGDLRKNKIVF